MTDMEPRESPRILLLLGPNLTHKNTFATLIRAKLNIVGAVVANKKKHGVNFSYLKIAVKKQGYFKVFLQILEKGLYKILNSKTDKAIYNEIFNQLEIKTSIDSWHGEVYKTENYQSKDTIRWILDKKPDIIVMHTPYWVGKTIRNITNGKIIGGHPGITPYYRGVHSSFWAAYNKEFDKIGYSVFWVDSGVDTGDLIYQEALEIYNNDSYNSLNWKGMVGIANSMARILKEYQDGNEIPRISHKEIPDKSLYYHPTIFNYLRYRFSQKKLR